MERQPTAHLGLLLTAAGVFLTAVGLIVAFVLGAQSSPLVRHVACTYFGIYCSRESEISIFSIDHPPRASHIDDDDDAWVRFLYYAGATASDSRCFAGSIDDLNLQGFVTLPNQNGSQTLQNGAEFWLFKKIETVALRKDRSLIFDLYVKYSESKVDQSILVTVKTYYHDYRISQMDTTYKITLPHGTDYMTISCGMPLPIQAGAYKYDFEIRDATDVSDTVIVHKAITITE
jgi:hypothetical protein